MQSVQSKFMVQSVHTHIQQFENSHSPFHSLWLIHTNTHSLSLARQNTLNHSLWYINTLAYAHAIIYFEKTKKQKISASAMLTTKICYISTFGTIIFTFTFADIHNFINDFFLFDFSQWFFFLLLSAICFWKKRKRISWELFSHMET